MGPIGTSNQLSTLSSPLGFTQGGASTNVLGYNQLQAPPNTSIPGGTGGATGGTGTSGSTASNNSYWNALINQANAAIGQLAPQAAIGHQNIANSFTDSFNSLTGQKNTAQNQYSTDVNNNQNNNLFAKNNIDQGVHNTVTGLQRLLGMHGGGDSSAALITAPYAAAQQGNQQRNSVQQEYGQNAQALDNNWTNTLNQFDNSFGSLDSQRKQQDNALDQQLDQTHQNLLQQEQLAQMYMGQAPNADIGNQINSLGAQITQLGAKPNFTPTPVSYAAPNLARYNYDATKAPTAAAQNPQNGSAIDNTGAYYTLLTDPNKKIGATA